MTRTILITGVSSGIGGVAADLFARKGWRVFGTVRADADATRLARTGITPVRMDVTDPDGVHATIAQIGRNVGDEGLQAVVNNAGLIINGPLELVTPEQLRRQFEVNVLGAVHVTRAALPLLRHGRGRIVNVSAPTASVAVPFMAPVSASKAALESISDALRIELAPWSIPVSLVVAGAADTGIFAKADKEADEARARAAPGLAELYERQLAQVRKANEQQSRTSPRTIADVLVRAVEERRPRTRYTAGAGVRMIGMLGGLPDRVRDRALTSALGLSRGRATSTAHR